MRRTWLSIRVELVSGRGEFFWPRPGRIFAASRSHSFALLAQAIEDAFARWERGHLHQFELWDGTRLTTPWGPGDDLDGALDDRRIRLSRLQPGEQFCYTFDLGDGWDHLCTVGEERVDAVAELGLIPATPLPFWGWGALPDQYGRRWDSDDGEGGPLPPDPRGTDLPRLGGWRRWQDA